MFAQTWTEEVQIRVVACTLDNGCSFTVFPLPAIEAPITMKLQPEPLTGRGLCARHLPIKLPDESNPLHEAMLTAAFLERKAVKFKVSCTGIGMPLVMTQFQILDKELDYSNWKNPNFTPPYLIPDNRFDPRYRPPNIIMPFPR